MSSVVGGDDDDGCGGVIGSANFGRRAGKRGIGDDGALAGTESGATGAMSVLVCNGDAIGEGGASSDVDDDDGALGDLRGGTPGVRTGVSSTATAGASGITGGGDGPPGGPATDGA